MIVSWLRWLRMSIPNTATCSAVGRAMQAVKAGTAWRKALAAARPFQPCLPASRQLSSLTCGPIHLRKWKALQRGKKE
jgi:hypothetical protein